MKKLYEAPQLVLLGEVSDLTKGVWGSGTTDSGRGISFTITLPQRGRPDFAGRPNGPVVS
jgi:hypothetical protein